MHDIEVGLIVCTVGCAAFGINYAARNIRHGCRLSPETEREIDRVGALSGVYPDGTFSPQMPLQDLLVIYLESRSKRQDVHREILHHPHKNGVLHLEMVCEKHRRIKRLFLVNLNERLIGILGLGLPAVSVRVILRTFGEEQEVVSDLYEN